MSSTASGPAGNLAAAAASQSAGPASAAGFFTAVFRGRDGAPAAGRDEGPRRAATGPVWRGAATEATGVADSAGAAGAGCSAAGTAGVGCPAGAGAHQPPMWTGRPCERYGVGRPHRTHGSGGPATSSPAAVRSSSTTAWSCCLPPNATGTAGAGTGAAAGSAGAGCGAVAVRAGTVSVGAGVWAAAISSAGRTRPTA
ncbi:hypothetical protein [Kitasatospora sp. NPDC056531]|uniref:hypothetical protein n=1 Tax=Kitasatospora sp. NPDC056531 TaxID=3345856 RepID=UPI00368E23BE